MNLFFIFMWKTDFVKERQEVDLVMGHEVVIWCVFGEAVIKRDTEGIIHIVKEPINSDFMDAYPAKESEEQAPQAT